MVEDKSACIVASDCVDIVCSVLRLLVESAARLRLSLGAAARRGRRLCGFWGAVVVAVAVSVSVAVAVALSVPAGVSSCWVRFAFPGWVACSRGCWGVGRLSWLGCSSAMTIGSAAVSPSVSWVCPILW
jgi:hypothetical protein